MLSQFLSHPLLNILRHDAIIASLVSLITCLVLIWTRHWHGEFSMDSSEGVQKIHTTPTLRIGGVGIALGVLAGFAASSHDLVSNEKRAILSVILLAGMPAFIFGLLEDLTKKVSVRARLVATMVSGVLGWGITGTSLTHLNIYGVDWLLSFTIISVIFTAIAVSGVANAINIIDGLNGLTTGTAMLMLCAFGSIAYLIGDTALAFSCLIIISSVMGFFIINWPAGKMFLGDGGAYFLGFTLAWVAVLLPERNPGISPWSSLLICSYPILEVVFSVLRRSMREGYSPTEPDAIHLHSLANRRWGKKLFSNFPDAIQNSLTSSLLWLYASISCISAVVFRENQTATIAALVMCIIIYGLMYSKLAFFRWIPQKK